MKRKKKLTKGKIATIIIWAVMCLAAVAVIITNIFIPVKYLSAYVNFKSDKIGEGQFRVSFIDVGFGDSTLFEFPDGKTMLVDAGDGGYSHKLKILKLLNKRKIDKIDYLVCSSVRAERCGGLTEIIKYKDIGKIYMPYCLNTHINDKYRKFSVAAAQCGAETGYCEYGGVFTEDYSFCFLSPSFNGLEGGEYEALNASPTLKNICNASAVIWVECGDMRILMLGDVLTAVADKIYSSCELSGALEISGHKVSLENCNILKVGNHGDKNSACAQLYDFVKPETAIISLGENGSGCPSARVLSDVQRHVADKLFRTDLCGTVTVTASGASYTVTAEKSLKL